jgi:hypothetical protein
MYNWAFGLCRDPCEARYFPGENRHWLTWYQRQSRIQQTKWRHKTSYTWGVFAARQMMQSSFNDFPPFWGASSCLKLVTSSRLKVVTSSCWRLWRHHFWGLWRHRGQGLSYERSVMFTSENFSSLLFCVAIPRSCSAFCCLSFWTRPDNSEHSSTGGKIKKKLDYIFGRYYLLFNLSHLLSFVLNFFCSWAKVDCKSDFSETRMPIVWMWTWKTRPH